VTILATQATLQAALVTAFDAMPTLPEVTAWPNTRVALPESPLLWAAVDFLWGEGIDETLGPVGVGTNVVVGVLQVTLFAPIGEGTGVLAESAAVLRAALGRQTLDGIRLDVMAAPVYLRTDQWQTAVCRVAFQVPEPR
jgi:hypothetical protein